MPSGNEIILSDTVGFISDLPHELIMSFRATLEEVLEADIIVHVRDISGEMAKQQRAEVISVLENLGLEHIEHKENYLEVLNKSDLLENDVKIGLEEMCKKKKNMILTSALTGYGINSLLQKIDDILNDKKKIFTIKIPAENGALNAYIYRNTEVMEVKNSDKYITFILRADEAVIAKIKKMNK